MTSSPARTPSVVLSYGLGVDSTAILLRWLTDPTSRSFDLADLVVVTAMTGDEWEQTGLDVAEHILPLMRQHGVRFVQCARERRLVTTAGDGVAVLDDSTSPTVLHLGGAYRLSDEMREAGTVPQTGGARLCSVHSKGDALDPVIASLTAGLAYQHVIGFEANEPKRAVKDTGYNTEVRTGVYPLIEWGWDRAACEAFILDVTGVAWDKSACVFCPFALSNKAGRARVLTRYAEQPAAGVATLLMEHGALALNPQQGLIGGTRAVDVVRQAGLTGVLDAFDAALDAEPMALFEVRRVLRPRTDDPTKMANAARAVRTLATGSRAQMAAALADAATAHGRSVVHGDDGIGRVWLRARGPVLPTGEHFLVVAPSVVKDKEHDRFDQWWDALAPASAVPAEPTDDQQLALTFAA